MWSFLKRKKRIKVLKIRMVNTEFSRETCDFIMQSIWGARIAWAEPSEFNDPTWAGDPKRLLSVEGHFTPKPMVGQTLFAEFSTSYKQFEFVKVKGYRNVTDMFFAKVKLIGQINK